MKRYLSSKQELSCHFEYPSSFLEMIAEDVICDLDPWWFLCEFEGVSDQWLKEIRNQYPLRSLVPFAKVSYSDDVACFDGVDTSGDPKVYYVHAFASPGWEDKGYVANFDAWLKNAREESVQYKKEQTDEN